MASFEETQIASLQQQIQKINAAISNSVKTGGSVVIGRDELTIVEAAERLRLLEQDLNDAITRREGYMETRESRKRQETLIQSQLDDALDKMNWAIEARNKGSISDELLVEYVNSANSLQQRLNQAKGVVPTSRRVAGAREIGAQQPDARMQRPEVPPSGYLDPAVASAYENRFGEKADVPQSGTTATPSGGAAGGAGAGAGAAATGTTRRGTKQPAPTYQPGWEDEVRRQYGKYAWMLDELDRTKYGDVFDLLAEAVNPDTKITDPALFLNKFEATSWYQELATQQKGRQVRAQVGALSFDPANYARLLNNSMRYGWEGDNLKAEAYKEVFRRNDDGSFANPNAVGEARKSNDYLSIQRIGGAFLSPMSDERIVETLTGNTTQDDLMRIYREKAKVNNPHLAAAIDAGVTLEDLAFDYRKAASDVLGMPVNSVPLTEDFLGQALRTGEPGKYRVMTTNEWKYLLKSNPEYGYQYTAKAREEVNNIVSSLEKAFGFVR
jgi:hypothetical protein